MKLTSCARQPRMIDQMDGLFGMSFVDRIQLARREYICRWRLQILRFGPAALVVVILDGEKIAPALFSDSCRQVVSIRDQSHGSVVKCECASQHVGLCRR